MIVKKLIYLHDAYYVTHKKKEIKEMFLCNDTDDPEMLTNQSRLGSFRG